MLPELPGAMEINCGEAEMRKSGSAPVVTVSWKMALPPPEIALTAKLPPGMSAGMVTGAFQAPPPPTCPVASVCPALGPESHLRVIFALGGNWEAEKVVWPPAATTAGDAESNGWPATPMMTVKK